MDWRRVFGGSSKKAEESFHFCPFRHAPLSSAIRRANVGSSSHLVDCRGSKAINGVSQGVWEEDLCGCCMVAAVGGVMVSFSSCSTDFQFDFTTPSHTCFRLSRASFDVSLSGECCEANGREWKCRIAFVEAFLVVWVRFFQWCCISFPSISMFSNPFLSLQLASFDDPKAAEPPSVGLCRTWY